MITRPTGIISSYTLKIVSYLINIEQAFTVREVTNKGTIVVKFFCKKKQEHLNDILMLF